MVKVKHKKYVNIPLPGGLAKQIEHIIKTEDCGYKTKSEFVKEAVRERLRELYKVKALRREITKH